MALKKLPEYTGNRISRINRLFHKNRSGYNEEKKVIRMNSHHFHPKDEERFFAELFLRQNKKVITGAPEGVDHLIRTVLNMVAQGKDIGVSLIEGDCTTQEAADILGVSRTFFIKLLQQGSIPYYKVGRQRRVQRKDLLKYDDWRRKKAREEFDKMFSENQEMGFYDR